jgi:two-component system, cell cycle response regulator
VTAPGLPRILIIDDSRIVRATIIKRVRDRFEVREEADGEAGWETLLIDPTIRLVITDQSMPHLDGYGLIERIRGSKLGRIREIPVIMISGDEDESARQRAKDIGATDFIAKGIGAAELLARLDALVALGRTSAALVEARAEAAVDVASGLATAAVLLRQADQAFAHARRHGSMVGVLVIGFDRYEELAAVEGQAVADALMNRFAKVLAGAIRKEDSLARWHDSAFAIVTPDIDAGQTRLFAERLRGAVAGASIQHEGHSLHVTVSVGLAHFPDDGDKAADAIIGVAERRMAQAKAAGGNQVDDGGMMDAEPDELAIDPNFGHIATSYATLSRAQLAELGRRLVPLLRLLDGEFQLGLPLADIERHLAAEKDEKRVSKTGS